MLAARLSGVQLRVLGAHGLEGQDQLVRRRLGMLSTHRRIIASPPPAELARLHWLGREAAAILEGTASGLSLRALDVLARS